jgi:ribonuclease P protein component
VLPKQHRIRHSKDFSRVYRSGRKATSAHLVVRVLKGLDEAQPNAVEPLSWAAERPSPVRVGIAVSQKVSKHAVVRNRLKRQIRAIMALLIPELPPQLWIVINLRPGADQCEYGEFLRELKQLLTQLEVIHGHS